jgi:hypothetical protein
MLLHLLAHGTLKRLHNLTINPYLSAVSHIPGFVNPLYTLHVNNQRLTSDNLIVSPNTSTVWRTVLVD